MVDFLVIDYLPTIIIINIVLYKTNLQLDNFNTKRFAPLGFASVSYAPNTPVAKPTQLPSVETALYPLLFCPPRNKLSHFSATWLLYRLHLAESANITLAGKV